MLREKKNHIYLTFFCTLKNKTTTERRIMHATKQKQNKQKIRTKQRERERDCRNMAINKRVFFFPSTMFGNMFKWDGDNNVYRIQIK